MAQLMRFEELDFYTDDEQDEDFSAFLSDDLENDEVEENDGFCDEEDEEVGIPFEKSEAVELPDEIEIPRQNYQNAEDLEHSLLDSLLGEALSGAEVFPRVEGLFDDFEDSDGEGSEKIDRRVLEDDDSGIEASRSVSEESMKVENVEIDTENVFDADMYLQYITEEEHAVPIDDVPDFASKRNVYGTSFNVCTGAIYRPPRFEFARRDDRWIDSCKELAYNPKNPVVDLITIGKTVHSVEKNARIDFSKCQSIDIHCKTGEEMAAMETHHIQKIICDAFNSLRLAVLIFGVQDGRITGCKMSPGKQDNLRLALDTAIQTEFVPPVENVLDAIDIKFLPVEGEKDTRLIVIRVKQLRNQKYHLGSEEESESVNC